MWRIYILRSEVKRWYYVGSTNRLKERLKEHNSGKVQSTKGLIPLQLIYTEEFASESEARKREREIKSKRIAKEAIIRHIENHWGIV